MKSSRKSTAPHEAPLGLGALLGPTWDQCLDLLSEAGVTWADLSERVDHVASTFELDVLEKHVLRVVTANQLCADSWLPMVSSIEDLSAHLVREAKIPNSITARTARLVREQWITVQGDQKLRVSPELASFLTGNHNADLHPSLTLWTSAPKNYDLWTEQDLGAFRHLLKQTAFVATCSSSDGYRDQTEVARLCKESDRPFWILDAGIFDEDATPDIRNRLALDRAVVGVIHAEDRTPASLRALLSSLAHSPVVVFQRKMRVDGPQGVQLFPASNHVRGSWWRLEFARRGWALPEDQMVRLQSLFTFSLEQTDRILDELHASGVKPSFESIAEKGRRQGSQILEQYSKKVDPRYDWDDLILPARTKLKFAEIYQHIAHRSTLEQAWDFKKRHNRGHGVTIVFEGESGTGKTMAAEVLAKALGLNLFQADLSKLTSKYIGDTEKNLSLIFSAARDASGILFFDEGEALFSKRTETQSSNDRYANLEVNYLLQELESYDGIVIISTNLAHNIDEAFLRRITFQVSFPKPDDATRTLIWKTHLASGMPLHEDVDFEFLGSLPVSGGIIKNISVLAASWAAIRGDRVTMKDVLWGIRREYSKLGLSLDRESFGEVYWKHVSPEWESVQANKRQNELRPPHAL